MEKLEADIAKKYPEMKTYMEDYKDSQKELTEYKEKAVTEAKAGIEEAQNYVDEVQTAINDYDNKQKTKEYGVSSSNLPENLFEGTLKGKEDYIAEMSEKYGIEPEFVAAIMALESGWGSSDLCNSSNNPGGLRASSMAVGTTSSNFAIFDNIETGIEAVIKNLSGYTQYDGVKEVSIDYVNQIGSVYCVGGNWAEKVKSLYDSIKAKEG